MEKLRMKSADILDEKVRKIAEIFPDVMTEAVSSGGGYRYSIDFDALKQELSDVVVEGNEERYQFNWPGKMRTRLLSNASVSASLRPCVEDSVNFDTTQNLYIEGDNLDVLKLLRETYLDKIKVIYIDPPYNTGNDFLYKDNFSQSIEEYSQISQDYDEQGNRLTQNLSSNGRFHTDWLNMMYSRLKVSKDLLNKREGSIFISVDDSEVHNLRKICDEIFGFSAYVTSIPRVTKLQRSGQEKHMDISHDYVMVYSYSEDFRHIMERSYESSNIMEDSIGKYIQGDTKAILAAASQGYSEGGDYDFVYNGKTYSPVDKNGKRNRWLWTKERMEAAARLGILVETKNTLREQLYINKKFDDRTNTMVDKDENLIFHTSDFMSDNAYTNSTGYNDLFKLFNADTPSNMYPKPVQLIKKLISFCFDKDATVLDFFSGSATTAQAVMQLNVEDGGSRKFIMVQLPEVCGVDSEVYRAGYKTICEIGKERIRRAGRKIKEEMGLMAQKLDIGFRVLKLDSSNMKDVYYNPDQTSQQSIEDMLSNVKEDRTPMDLLFQVMLETPALLSSKIDERTLEGKKVFVVNDNDLICCFDDDIGDDVVKAIAQMKPLYAVFRDSSFKSDDTMVNAEQYFRTYAPDTQYRII